MRFYTYIKARFPADCVESEELSYTEQVSLPVGYIKPAYNTPVQWLFS